MSRALLVLLLPLVAHGWFGGGNDLPEVDIVDRQATDFRLKITNADRKTPLGLIWEGDDKATQHFEKRAAVIAPGDVSVQNSFFGHSFALRSADMKFSFRLFFDKSEGSDEHEYKIHFRNLNHAEGSNVELKHSTSGYLWLHAGDHVSHNTDANHVFTLRDSDRKALCHIMLLPPPEEDL